MPDPLAVTLLRKDGKIFARVGDSEEPVAVRLLWARPVTGRGAEISLLDEKKREVAMLRGLDALDPESRQIAEQVLAERYLIAEIRVVRSTRIHLGGRFWEVETDRGPKRFVLKDPNRDVTKLAPDELLLRDAMGNRFRIASLSQLDARSRAEIERVLDLK